MKRQQTHSRFVRLLAFALFGIAAGAAEASSPPNILLIFTDDQAYDTVHALSGIKIETPNLDRLARRSTTFSRAYNMGAWHGAVCVASRTMLNTGRFLWYAHQDESRLGSKYIAANRLWPQQLSQAGYQTFFTGKWHVKCKPDQVFQTQQVHHVRPGMPGTVEKSYDRPPAEGEDPWSPYDRSLGGYWQGGRHWSEVVADDAENYFRDAAQSDDPFFMYVAFNAPHDPRQSPKEFVDRYPVDQVSVPKSFLPEYPFNQAMGAGRTLRDERLAPFPRTKHAVQTHLAEYYAIITHLDVQVGRILDALQQSGRADNTYVFFTSDHGLACGRHGLLGKQSMFDHSVRVPLMLSGPGIPAGKTIDAPVYLQDIMPTSLELAGAEISDQVQFRSLLPLVRGERKTSYDAIYGAYMNRQRMVTVGHWKLILYPTIGKVLLFDLKNDSEEMHNLADRPEHQERVGRLFVELRNLQQATGDTLDLSESFPEGK
ncbi:MAG: sulfatase-like hydrolase/transferase [Planctomycetes bacterium]|nr:sulfatase-like hydrolase/transferase [Planctomycetota bacterium]